MHLSSVLAQAPAFFVVATLLASSACQESAVAADHPTDTTAAENTGNVQPSGAYAGDLPLSSLNLPAGYAIDVFAEDLENARSIAYAGDGLVFVGTRNEGSVYAVQDTNGDMRADVKYTLATDLTMPNGVALKDGDLYVATVNEILRWRDIRSKLADPGAPEVVYGDFPTEQHHGWKYIAFGPDGMLYVPVGAPCNICESDDDVFASITRLDVDAATPKPEIVAHGVRNSVGFTWHPETGDMWFTDNGRDMLGDDIPPCELNRIASSAPIGGHYGYPYVHGGTILDPEFGEGHSVDEFVAPVQNLGPHVAPLGVEFVNSEVFADFGGSALIAEHGSWNRTDPIGYRISRVPLSGEATAAYEVFIDGWLQDDGPWGRPVDLEWMPDGSLLISDDFAGVIYRVYKIA